MARLEMISLAKRSMRTCEKKVSMTVGVTALLIVIVLKTILVAQRKSNRSKDKNNKAGSDCYRMKSLNEGRDMRHLR